MDSKIGLTGGGNLPLYPPTADTLVLQAAQKTASVFETSYHMPGIQIHLKVFFQSRKIFALRTKIHFISTFAKPWLNQIPVPYFPYRIVKIQWYSFYHPSHNHALLLKINWGGCFHNNRHPVILMRNYLRR